MRISCGIDAGGAVQCWGDNRWSSGGPPWETGWYDQHQDEPPPLTDAVQVVLAAPEPRTVFGGQACARLGDGTLRCWGPNLVEPAASRHFADVALAVWHVCAIEHVGTEALGACWTSDDLAGTPMATRIQSPTTVRVSDADDRACFTNAGGDAECLDLYGAADGPALPAGRYRLVVPAEGTLCMITEAGGLECTKRLVLDVDTGRAALRGLVLDPPSVGGPYSDLCLDPKGTWGCAIDADAHVRCFGQRHAEPAQTRPDDGWLASPPQGVAFTQLSCGTYHACGITSEGRIACWGRDNWGQASPP